MFPFGLKLCMNLYGWALCSHLPDTDPGASNDPRCWWKWEATCAKCCLPVKPMRGLFCGNFCSSRREWPACRQAWHEECYTCLGPCIFPMTEIKDEEGNLWHNSEARMKRLNTGVNGAHACIPFQCETCWMRNLEGRNISKGDEAYEMCLRRENLDAIAGKAEKRISSHKDKVLRTVKICKTIRKTSSYAPRGPFPLEDSCGMGLVVEMLVESYTAIGRITDFVQFETIRRLRSTYTKVFESSPAGASKGSSFARGTGRVRPTSCPSQSE